MRFPPKGPAIAETDWDARNLKTDYFPSHRAFHNKQAAALRNAPARYYLQDAMLGQSLGHYTILEKLGQGGMGVVNSPGVIGPVAVPDQCPLLGAP